MLIFRTSGHVVRQARHSGDYSRINIVRRNCRAFLSFSSSAAAETSSAWYTPYLTTKNIIVGSVLGTLGGVGFGYKWKTDAAFARSVEESGMYKLVIGSSSKVYDAFRGPVDPPSPFTVENLALSTEIVEKAGQLFITLDLQEKRGLTKIKLIDLLDGAAGYDLAKDEGKTMNLLLRGCIVTTHNESYAASSGTSRATIENEGKNLVALDQNREDANVVGGASKDDPLFVLKLHRDQQTQIAMLEMLRRQIETAKRDADASWWLFGLGSRNTYLKLASELEARTVDVERKAELAKARYEDEENALSYCSRDVVSLDEYLVTLSEFARLHDDDDEATSLRLDRMMPVVEKGDEVASGRTTGIIDSVGTQRGPFDDMEPLPVSPEATMDDVDVSDRAVIEHELSVVRERRKCLLETVLRDKPEAEWSVAQRRALVRIEAQEAELTEELSALA